MLQVNGHVWQMDTIHNLTRTMTETMGITSLKQKECPTRQWKSNGVEVLQNAKDPDTCQCGI